MYCYDVIVYTLDHKLSRLTEALRQTTKINWMKDILFPCTRIEFKNMLCQIKEEKSKPFNCFEPDFVWWLPRSKALQFAWRYGILHLQDLLLF